MAPLYYTIMTDEYENLLKQAYSNITEKTESSERFVVPEAKAYVEGKTTVLENFSEIVSKVRRDPDHLMKFLLGELVFPEKSMETVQFLMENLRSRSSK